MWLRLNLRYRIYILLVVLVLITLSGGLLTVWYTYQMEGLLSVITEKNLVSLQTAQGLESALVNQKGFLSYYFLDNNEDWLEQMAIYRGIFDERLEETKNLAEGDKEREGVQEIELQYRLYVSEKDQVIELYKKGERKAGIELHQSVRGIFFKILHLCEQYKTMQTEKILQAKNSSHDRAMKFRVFAFLALLAGICLALFLAFLLVSEILGPIQKLTLEARGDDPSKEANHDEMKALSSSVHHLIENADQTYTELMKSRESLMQAEKLALVGKLAAGMAHSIRNPFTSVKMRLFSLNRSIVLTDYQKEDFDVITQEIKHIDTILQNFLEFSRPPKLKMQLISPSQVVDFAIQLLEHRLRSYDVTVEVIRDQVLPETLADPEQLKEVLVNLIINACEAFTDKGLIVIEEEVEENKKGKKFATLKIRDNGPGISQPNIDKLFQPFFTTKEEGTGLGLSIAARIVEEHGGILDVTSMPLGGATFIITLPIRGE
ncbi:MAG: MCP four helix bundle domain-containing protein [Proteobacteria bacterium]|nr:MCP four helix bundle domain-containing protein [Pseudomonadota bacterium]MBU4471925.1 MCP four helix bundle domain-containing protein [Pseudomonadota bacterium]MCG2752799.1 ATP-binding protein [Desulfobacteraceae bacterium]